jgi:acid phosphatase
MLNDGHNTSLEYAARWTRSFLIPLLANEYFMNNTLVLLTYDESETYSLPNKIVSILLGGAVPSNLKGTTDDTFYTHYSILSTLENNWDLPNLGRYDVGANVFKLVADQTGYKNERYDVSTVNLSASYSGFLNTGTYGPIPPPNLQLVGAGSQGVLAAVSEKWQSTIGETTPYDGSGKVYDGNSPPVYAPT